MLLISFPAVPASASSGSPGYSSSPALEFGRNATLTSPNAQEYGEFGSSVATSSKLLVVGAPGETVDFEEYAGHVYIFNAANDQLVRTLTSPDVQGFGLFGYSVAISGKLLVVGSDGETIDGNFGAGQAYVFNTATGKLISTLTSPNAQEDGLFGDSVAISGKLVVVGAYGETVDGDGFAGHAYIFNADTGKLIRTLTSPNVQGSGEFGISVATSSKLVVVGAEAEVADGYGAAGHAYIFNATTGKLIYTLTSPNAQEGGFFGDSVGIMGNNVIVGAYAETVDGYTAAGHAYIFNATTGMLVTTLTSPNAQETGLFGASVSVSGKLVAVGAYQETAGGHVYAGHAYIFDTTGELIGTLTSPNAQVEGYFGWSVGITGKLSVVGAWGETADGYYEAGHAYVFKV